MLWSTSLGILAMSDVLHEAESERRMLRRLHWALRWGSLTLLVSAVGCETAIGCGCSTADAGSSKSQELVFRCTQSPALTLTDAWCACIGYEPGKEKQPQGLEVSVCDAKLPCCFIGPAPSDREDVVVGEKECRCVHDASCSAEMAERQGATSVTMCPPPD
jgi:hypothetical protein